MLNTSETEREIFSNEAIELQVNQERFTYKLRLLDICVWLDSSEPLLKTGLASHLWYELARLC